MKPHIRIYRGLYWVYRGRSWLYPIGGYLTIALLADDWQSISFACNYPNAYT